MVKKLNFCCGNDIKDGFDNCDWQKSEKIIYCDANLFPYPFENNTYDYIYLHSCFQLFDNPRKVLEELWRINKNEGVIEIITAHYSNKGAYTDFDTKHYFNELSFKMFIDGNCRINHKKMFEIIELKLVPTWIGKFIPFRKKLSLLFGGLIGEIHIKLKVVKLE